MTPPNNQFAVACPSCGIGLKVGDSDLGTQRDCPKCGTGFVLPSLAEARRLAEAKRLARQQFGFDCRLCGSRLYAMPRQIGRKMKCPDCHAINVISQPPQKAHAKTIQTGEEYDLALADEKSIEALLADELLFNFHCRVCNTVLSVPRPWVGRQLPCPDCGTQLIVPLPPPAAATVKVVAKDPGITLGAAAPIPQQQIVNVDKLMTAANEKLAVEAKQKLKPIQRPFVSGVYTYPFQPLSLGFLVLTSLLGGLVFVLVRTTIELQSGPESVIGIPLMIAAGVITIPLIGLCSSYFLQTIQWTSQGYPGISEIPPFEFFEFLRSSAFIVNAFGVSALPGLLIGLVVPNRLIGSGLLMLSVFLLYPFVILSMIDDDSVFTPYSSFIGSTLKSLRRPWVKFYVSVLLVVGMVAVTQVLAAFFPSENWWFVTIAAINLAGLIYFRLIGRLAYVIDRSIPKEKPQRPEFKP